MNAPEPTSALQVRHVSKVFQGQRALADVDLDVRKGEVHALLGPNGCGKSTLIKILAGYHQPESGAQAWFHGEAFELGSPTDGRQLRFIHQDLGLVLDLDAVDNLALGGTYSQRWWISQRRERALARERLRAHGAEVDVTRPLHRLSRAQQTMVALVRAVTPTGAADAAPFVVLDEPTAALPAKEVQVLFDLIRRIRDAGGSVLYVTHRLNEVLTTADRVTVLRDGRNVTTRDVAGLDHEQLVELIVGRAVETFHSAAAAERSDAVLEVDGVRGQGVAELTLAVHRGEVVGISGLVGSGYEDALGLVFGSIERTGGNVRVEGAVVAANRPHRSINAGIAYAPADRKRLSAITDWTLRENVTLPAIRSRGAMRWLSDRREAVDVAPYLHRVQVDPPLPHRTFSSLSGGNQQKVVLARWLRRASRVFLLEEPTNGVDMGAKRAIYRQLADVADAGAAVLMTSQDPEELASVCHRVLIMHEGRIAAELSGSELTEDRIVTETLRQRARCSAVPA